MVVRDTGIETAMDSERVTAKYMVKGMGMDTTWTCAE
jgi:hypothetical protein